MQHSEPRPQGAIIYRPNAIQQWWQHHGPSMAAIVAVIVAFPRAPASKSPAEYERGVAFHWAEASTSTGLERTLFLWLYRPLGALATRPKRWRSAGCRRATSHAGTSRRFIFIVDPDESSHRPRLFPCDPRSLADHTAQHLREAEADLCAEPARTCDCRPCSTNILACGRTTVRLQVTACSLLHPLRARPAAEGRPPSGARGLTLRVRRGRRGRCTPRQPATFTSLCSPAGA